MIKEKIIEIQNLNKKYGNKVVFNNFNLDIFQGDRVALLGPNGVGKTTLIEIICGLCKITSGKVNFIQGRNNFFENLGIQFQTGNYPNAVRVCDLIYLYKNVYNQKIDENLRKKLQIKKIEKKDVNDLSFGQKKRVELFLLLSMKAKFLILDEITSGMDIYIKMQTLKVLKRYIEEKNVNIIYVSHNPEEISLFCNRLIILNKEGIAFDKKIDGSFDIKEKTESILLRSVKTTKEKNEQSKIL